VEHPECVDFHKVSWLDTQAKCECLWSQNSVGCCRIGSCLRNKNLSHPLKGNGEEQTFLPQGNFLFFGDAVLPQVLRDDWPALFSAAS
jgi:hypothetical protein